MNHQIVIISVYAFAIAPFSTLSIERNTQSILYRHNNDQPQIRNRVLWNNFRNNSSSSDEESGEDESGVLPLRPQSTEEEQVDESLKRPEIAIPERNNDSIKKQKKSNRTPNNILPKPKPIDNNDLSSGSNRNVALLAIILIPVIFLGLAALSVGIDRIRTRKIDKNEPQTESSFNENQPQTESSFNKKDETVREKALEQVETFPSYLSDKDLEAKNIFTKVSYPEDP